MKKRNYDIFLFTIIACILTVTASFARDVTLQWNPVSDGSVTGYKVYYNVDSSGTPFNGAGAVQGTSPVDTRNVTSATLTGLDPSRSYYFAVTAYNASGVESSYSNVVSVAEAVPPTVTITSPGANSTISGTTSVAINANDNVGVTKVELYVDGNLAGTDTATPYSVSLNTSTLAVGTHTLLAKAYDAAGNVGQSSIVSVTVANDTTPPVTTITSPANGSAVSGMTTVSIAATDNIGVSKVELYLNGTLFATYGSAPFDISWDTTKYANGSYTLTAKAYDASGNVSSAQVQVTLAPKIGSVGTVKGDMNGDGIITVADAIIALKQMMSANPNSNTNADVYPLDVNAKPSGNGVVDINDILTILKRSIGSLSW
ncbi:Ig-like domain-containing protein [Geobacter sp.]|uniref:Ig-like domain-containing protein n=1 Tax=Geobacter sp. TaxID=46610 RepID=UPI0026318AE3|nr:Ig-like domain-containing protein [Geobacter sp.]